jgi:hypothetical protein
MKGSQGLLRLQMGAVYNTLCYRSYVGLHKCTVVYLRSSLVYNAAPGSYYSVSNESPLPMCIYCYLP